jgi:hypothetical protein
MELRHIFISIISGLLLIGALVFNTLFIGVYGNSYLMWIYGGLITVIINSIFIQGIILPISFWLIRILKKRK